MEDVEKSKGTMAKDANESKNKKNKYPKLPLFKGGRGD